MFTVEYVKNPVFNDENNQTVTLIVKFVELEDEVPYGVNSWDKEPHGIELYTNVMAGVYGPIAPYSPPELDGEPLEEETP